jgi:hypothetical protein
MKTGGLQRNIWRWQGVLLLLILGGALSGKSQIIVQNGANAPTVDVHADWYLDTLAHQAWVRQDGEWTKFFLEIEPVEKIVPCRNDVLLYTTGLDGVAEREGRAYIHTIQCECRAHAVVFYADYTIGFIRDNNTIAWSSGENFFSSLPGGRSSLDSINGKPYYCMTNAGSVPYWLRFESDLHYWGIIDDDGQWIVEPKFDMPFKFENGRAIVSYYGLIRTINSKGEFLD